MEFALVSFALYLLMVVLLDLGRGTLAAQTIQGAADVLVQELARAPLPATADFSEALEHPYVKSSIFDEELLVVVLDASLQTPAQIDAHFAAMPIVNQMLRPLMISDVLPGGSGAPVLRYPGALVQTPSGGYTVFVPIVEDRQWTGQNTLGFEDIRWSRVVEEVTPNAVSHFPINSTGHLAGFVNLRINYPYQAAAMSAYHPDDAVYGPEHVVIANDGAVTESNSLPSGYSAVGATNPAQASIYSGKYGLGHHFAVGERVRPYRKVLSAQAAARREVITHE